MPTFCIIGGTGRTGHLLLQNLASTSENQVRVYVRNKAKVDKLSPGLALQDNVVIFEGGVKDVNLLRQCIGTSSTLFLVTASPDNDPCNKIVQETAHAVVAALSQRQHEDKQAQPPPHIISLSTATINPTFNRYTPTLVQFLLTSSLNHKYDAFRETQEFLQLHSGWLKVTFVQPGGLVHDDPKGYRLSLDDTKTFLSFADLALGMIEIARDGHLYEGKCVSVVPTGENVKKNLHVPAIVLQGYLWRFFPGIYSMVRRWQQ